MIDDPVEPDEPTPEEELEYYKRKLSEANAETDSLRAELAEAKALVDGLRGVIDSQKRANDALIARIVSLQSHNAKLMDCLRMSMIGSCSCLTKTDAPKFHEPDCVYRMIKECLASQPAFERLSLIASLRNLNTALIERTLACSNSPSPAHTPS